MRRVHGIAIAGATMVCAAIAVRLWFATDRLSTPTISAPPLPANIDHIDRGIADRVRKAALQIDAQPRESDRWRTLALVYQANGIIDLAIQCHTQAVALDPTNARSWYMLGLALYKQGDGQGAKDAIHRVIELERTYSPAWWRLGFINLDQGNLDDAQYAFEVALSLEPNNLASLVGLTRVDLQLGEHHRAALSLAAIAQQMPPQHPTFGYVNYLLSTAYRRLDKDDQADRALALSKSNLTEPMWNDPWEAEQAQHFADVYARMNHAEWLASEGRLDEAMALAHEILNEKPRSISMLLLIAGCLRHQGKFDESLAMIAKAEAMIPDWVPVHVSYARTKLAQSEHAAPQLSNSLRQQALDHIKKGLTINPTHPMAHGVNGDVLMTMGRFDQAAEAFSTAAQHDRQPIPWLMQAAEARGKNRQWDEAVQLLARVAQLAPNFAEAWFQLGVAQAHTGAAMEAQESLLRAQQLRPDDQRVRAELAKLQSRDGMQPMPAEIRR